MNNDFLKALQEVADTYNGYDWVECLSDQIIKYIDQFMASSSEEEIEKLIITMQQDCQKIYDSRILAIENEKKIKEQREAKLVEERRIMREEHMKYTGHASDCDCFTKAPDYGMTHWPF